MTDNFKALAEGRSPHGVEYHLDSPFPSNGSRSLQNVLSCVVDSLVRAVLQSPGNLLVRPGGSDYRCAQMSTFSPLRSPARRRRQYQAERGATGRAAAESQSRSSGIFTTWRVGTATYSA